MIISLEQYKHLFDGSQANLRNWLNEVDKFAFINRIDDNATKLIAYQSAGGKCSEFLQRVFWGISKG